MSAELLRAEPFRVAYNGVAEAALAAGIRPHHLRIAIARGELRVHRVGRRSLITRDALLDFIERRPSPQSRRARAYAMEAAYA